jgi:Zn ribbon nucleic-acid-binding protein
MTKTSNIERLKRLDRKMDEQEKTVSVVELIKCMYDKKTNKKECKELDKDN